MARTTTDGGRVAMGRVAVGRAAVVQTVGAGTEVFVSIIKFLRMLELRAIEGRNQQI